MYSIRFRLNFRDAIDVRREVIIAKGVVICTLRYADDIVVLATAKDDLQTILSAVTSNNKQRSLKLNIKINQMDSHQKKTKPNNITVIRIEAEMLEKEQIYKYLNCWLNEE